MLCSFLLMTVSQTLMFQIRGVSMASQCVAIPDIPNWGGCVNCGCPRSRWLAKRVTAVAQLLSLAFSVIQKCWKNQKNQKIEKKICLPSFFLSLLYKLLFLSSKTLITALWHLKIQIYHQVAKTWIWHRNHSFHRWQHGPHQASLVPKDSWHYGQVWPDPLRTWLSEMNPMRRTK